mmetsp:Transcript_1043/g.2701  ORF Transcript_1043/g.2701 Transcript_1043/m.2701 type:complete len:80 (+) Transcript_1043:578-817(+)
MLQFCCAFTDAICRSCLASWLHYPSLRDKPHATSLIWQLAKRRIDGIGTALNLCASDTASLAEEPATEMMICVSCFQRL